MLYLQAHGLYLLVADAAQDEDELVTAQAGHDIIGAQQIAQAQADLGQCQIAVVMAPAVIERLEAVRSTNSRANGAAMLWPGRGG
jgi:hypothetical protein